MTDAASTARLRALLDSRETRFLLAGAYNTVFGYVVFAALYRAFAERLGLALVLVIAYIVATLSAFLVQRKLVFRSEGAALPELWRFAGWTAVILAGNLLLLPLMIGATGWNAYVCQALFVAASTLASYLAHRFHTFAATP